jgi:hypothetical protein
VTDKQPSLVPWAWLAGAAVLVVVYVNTFDLWRALSASLGERAGLMPYGIALLVAGAFFLARRRGTPVLWPWIVAGLAAGAMGLLITDPDFPGKRIHVPQYMLLAVVIRAGLRRWLGGMPLLVFGVLLTALYGVHDEMVQGLHPKRTYGLLDMAVNALGGIAGTLVAHGMGFLPGRGAPHWPPIRLAAAGACAILGMLLLAAALTAFRGVAAPVWTILPVLAGALMFSVERALAGLRSGAAQAAGACVLAAVLCVVYPVLSHVAPLVFE